MQGKFVSIHDRFLNLAESSQWPEITKKFGMCTFVSHCEKDGIQLETIICVTQSLPMQYTETNLMHLVYMLQTQHNKFTVVVPSNDYYRHSFEILTGILLK